MARRVLYETNYTFTPSTRTIVIQRYIPRERLILITNVTTGVPIFNFSDSRLTATSYTATASYTGAAGGQGTTTIVLAYNTTAMSGADRLQIMLDEPNEMMTPSEALMDPVGKLRVSMPQSLIDTDFEYGLQPTKWENMNLISNKATLFYLPNQTIASVTNIATTSGSRAVTVSTTAAGTAGLVVGAYVFVQGTTYGPADGYYLIDTVTAGASFTYLMKNNAVATTSIWINGITNLYLAFQYTGCTDAVSTITNSGTTVTVATTHPHGLHVGNYVMLRNFVANTNAPNGAWCVTAITSPTTFSFQAISTPTGTIATTRNLTTVAITGTGGEFSCDTTTLWVGMRITISGTLGGTGSITGYASPTTYQIFATNGSTTFTLRTLGGGAIVTTAGTPTGLTYATSGAQGVAGELSPRPEGVFYHRAFDGGVQYNSSSSFHGLQTMRQSRRYFRYQSGKGIQFSTNVIMKPGMNVDVISSVGNVVTVQTKIPHNLSTGVSITVSGCTPTAYNGTFTITSIIDHNRFTYTAGSSPGAFTFGIPFVVVNSWFNSMVRVGMFDSQNGFFFEFDGQNLYAVRRNTSTQLSGTVAVTNQSSTVTGTNTLFSKQMAPGDFISIRGMSYRVATIASDTSMTIMPEYRGNTVAAGVVISKTIDTKVAQSSWNIDPMNGTGPSGYNIDLTRIQMIYMDYSWYGAGAIRFGFKDIKGEVQYCHRLVHNNSLTEAFMRSGNLPARYETNTLGAYTYVTATLANSGTTLTVADTSLFPSSGSLMIQNPLATTALTSVTIADTAGGFTCASTTLAVGMNVTIVGTYGGTGSITGYVTGNVYRISATNGSTTFTLQTQAGAAIVTTAGTPTGLTYTPSAYEYVVYTGKSATTFTGLIRGTVGSSPASVVTTSGSATITGASLTTAAVQVGMFITGAGIPDGTHIVSIVAGTAVMSQAATASATITATVYAMGAVNPTHTYSATSLIGVYGHSPQFSPLISHWGSSVIMDGRFDDDKSFVFTTGMTTSLAIGAGATNCLLSLRVSPAASDGITATLGLREIINRMQLVMRSIGLQTDGRFLGQLILNGVPSGGTFATPTANPSSLAQVAVHGAGTTITGGEAIYAFYTEGAGAGVFTTTARDVQLIRDLGNSILGGAITNNVNQNAYPDGPDILTLVLTNLEGSSRNAIARIGWTEAQA